MITLEHITIHERPANEDCYAEVTARLRLNATLRLEHGASDELKQEAVEQTQRTIWHQLYGDIEPQLMAIREAVMMIFPDRLSQHQQNNALELMSALMAKCRFPRS